MSTTNTNTTAIGTLGSLQQNLVKLDNKYMTKINTNASDISSLNSKVNQLSSAGLKRVVLHELLDESLADFNTIYMIPMNNGTNNDDNYSEHILVGDWWQSDDTSPYNFSGDEIVNVSWAGASGDSTSSIIDVPLLKCFVSNVEYHESGNLQISICHHAVYEGIHYLDEWLTLELYNSNTLILTDYHDIFTYLMNDRIYFDITYKNDNSVYLRIYDTKPAYELIGNTRVDLTSKMDRWGTVTYYNNGSVTNIASDTKSLMISAIENYPAHLYFDYDEGLAELHGISSAVLSGGVENQLKIGYTNASFASKSGVDMIVTGIADPSNSNDAVNKGYVDFEIHKLRNTLINRQIVSELPDETYASTNTIYMIRKTDSDDSDIYDEYMYTYRKNYKSDWSMTLLDGDASNFTGLDLDFNRDTKFNVEVITNPSNAKQHIFTFYDSTDIRYTIPYTEDETVFLDTNVSRILDELRLAILHGESSGTWFNINRYTTPQLEGEYRVTITAFTESYSYELIGSSKCDLSDYQKKFAEYYPDNQELRLTNSLEIKYNSQRILRIDPRSGITHTNNVVLYGPGESAKIEFSSGGGIKLTASPAAYLDINGGGTAKFFYGPNSDHAINLKGISNPIDATDASNKQYVDDKFSALASTALTREVWDELLQVPVVGHNQYANKIVLIRNDDMSKSGDSVHNVYDEYIHTIPWISMSINNTKDDEIDWSTLDWNSLMFDPNTPNTPSLVFGYSSAYTSQIFDDSNNFTHLKICLYPIEAIYTDGQIHEVTIAESAKQRSYVIVPKDHELVNLITLAMDGRITTDNVKIIFHNFIMNPDQSVNVWYDMIESFMFDISVQMGVWEKIGSSSCDLSGYVTTETYNNKVTNLENRITELESVITEFSEKMSELSNDTASVI